MGDRFAAAVICVNMWCARARGVKIKEEDYKIRPDWKAMHGEKQRKACGADDFSRLIAAGHYTDI